MTVRVCSEDGCDHTDVKVRGVCQMHYTRARRAGTLDQYEVMGGAVLDRWTCECPDPVLLPLGECSSCFRPPLGLLLTRLARRAA